MPSDRKRLRENVNFMWLAGGNQPDFHTINDFRGKTMKEAVRAVFTKVLELLVEEGYIKMENYFVDGTKIGANANAHKKEDQTLQGKVAGTDPSLTG